MALLLDSNGLRSFAQPKSVKSKRNYESLFIEQFFNLVLYHQCPQRPKSALNSVANCDHSHCSESKEEFKCSTADMNLFSLWTIVMNRLLTRKCTKVQERIVPLKNNIDYDLFNDFATSRRPLTSYQKLRVIFNCI